MAVARRLRALATLMMAVTLPGRPRSDRLAGSVPVPLAAMFRPLLARFLVSRLLFSSRFRGLMIA
jgi:hypothetical protein